MKSRIYFVVSTKLTLALLLFLYIAHSTQSHAQIFDPFELRYQNAQKGGIRFLSNVAISCTGTGACSNAQAQMPPSGNGSNESFNMNYIDFDAVPTTFMSSSDSLNLEDCSEVLWAGLYWSAEISTFTQGYSNRGQVKLGVNSDAYIDLVAEETEDVMGISHPSYHCFKDITSIVQSAGIKARFTVADMIARTNAFNVFGGWSIVVVYKNVYESMRNLTVFDGFAAVSNGSSLDIPISGFNTPLAGPVSFELGVIAHEGDRGATGDGLSFNGGSGTFQAISDALHPVNNCFNSTISYGAVVTPFRIPSYNNNLGYDAAIYIPDNSSFNYIGNNSSSATIRVATSNENILCRVLTSAIDIYEPDLRASVYIDDLNGGIVEPGDILEYTLVGKNIGSDLSLNTFIVDTLDPRTQYVASSISIDFGPNSGAKTDLAGDDQAEYDAATNSIKVRIGTGSDAFTGGEVIASPEGSDSTVIKFRVTVVDDCLMFQCDSTLEHVTYIFGTGDISQNEYGNNGASDLLDANGCPLTASNALLIDVSGCPPPVVVYNDPLCETETLDLAATFSALANYSWSGPNGFSGSGSDISLPDVALADTGDYHIQITFDGLDCLIDTFATVVIHPNPIVSLSGLQNVLCFGDDDGYISTNVVGEEPIVYSWSNSASVDSISNLAPGEYILNTEDAFTCITIDTFNITEPTALVSNASILTDFNGFNVSCFADSNGLAEVTYSGGTSPYEVLWSNGDTTDVADSLAVGAYNALVTDTNGCEINASLTLSQPPLLELGEISSAVSCFGGDDGSVDLSVNGGVPDYAFIWSNSELEEDIDTLIAGDYSVLVTDLNGCTDTLTATITEPLAPLSISESHINVDCFGNATGSIDITVAGGTAPYTYLWNTSATTEDLTGMPLGTYTLTVTDTLNCTEVITIEITQPAAPLEVTLLVTDVSCFGDSTGAIDATVTGGTFPYTYLWSSTDTTEDLSGIPFGNYAITVTDTNACAFTVESPVTQPSDSLFASLEVTDVDCFGASTGAIESTVSGGTAPYTYLWSNTESTSDILDLFIGTYDLLVVDTLGCSLLIIDSIQEPLAPLSISEAHINVDCFGNATGSIDITVAGGTAPYTYLWNTSATTEDLTDLALGIYTLTVTDTLNCTEVIVIEVTEPAAPLEVTLLVTDVSCFGDSTGAIDATVTGGTFPYTYLWNTTDTTEDLTELPIGTYSITVTDTNACAFTIDSPLTQPSDSLFASLEVTDVDCFGASTGSIESTVSGGTAPYSYLWSNTENTADIVNVLIGTYELLVSDSLGCSLLVLDSIQQPEALFLTHSQVDILCFGDATGSIDLTVSGGVSPFTYLWSNGSVTEDLSNIPTGDYDVVVTDSNGCQEVRVMSLSEPLGPLTLSETHTDALCIGGDQGTIDLTVTGGTLDYSYFWNNNQLTEDIIDLVPGVYIAQVTDDHGCIDSITIEILDPSNTMVLSVIETDVSCFEGSDGGLDLTVTGGAFPYSFDWSNTGTTEDISGLVTGNYFVIVQDGNFCESFISGFIEQPFAPLSISEAHINVDCFGNTTGSIDITVNGGTAPYSYLWNTGSTLADLTGMPFGSYTLTVTDTLNCTKVITIEITQPAATLEVTLLVTDVSCFGDSTGSIDATVTGGTFPYTYLWNTTDIIEDLSGIPFGNYSITVTDTNACAFTIESPLTQPNDSLFASFEVTDVDCFGSSTGSIESTVSGGTAPYTYLWSNAEITSDIIDLFIGTYDLLVVDSLGCSLLILDSIQEPLAALSATDSITTVACHGDSTGAIQVTTAGGTSPYTYAWDNGSVEEDIDSIFAGSYTLVITDENLCTDTNTYIVNEPLALVLGSDLIAATCFGDSDGSIDLTPAGGVSPYTYQWSNDSTTQDLDSLIAGDYTLVLTDENLCTATVTLTINEPAAAISVTADSSNISCFGGNDGFIDITVVGGNGSYSYIWSNAALSEDLTDLFIGNYTVDVQDFKGCTTSLSMTLTQPDAPLSLSVEMTPVICFSEDNGTATVTATGGTVPYTYLWSNTEDSLFIDSLIAGDYSVLVTDSLLCFDTITVTVTEPPILTAVADSIDVLCHGDSTGTVSVVAQGGVEDYSYLWDTGTADTTTVVDSLPAGTYTVVVTDTNGCFFETSTTINQPLAPLSGALEVTDNICFGDSLATIDATISGGILPYSYLWSNDSITAYIDSLAVGPYLLTVTDSNACVFVIDTVIVSPTLLVVQDTVSNVNCFGGSDGWIDLTVSEATAPYQYLWSNLDTLQDLDTLIAGTYEVMITDSNNCVTLYPVTVTEPLAPLTLSMDSINVFCFGDTTGSIDLNVTGGTPVYSYLWNTADTLQDVDSLVTGTYQVIVTDTNQCVDSLSVFIDQPLAPIALSATQVDILCFGDATGAVDLTVSGGTPASTGYVFDWNSGAFATEDLTDIPFGPYAVLVTDSLLCSDTLSVLLTQPDAPLDIDFTILNVSCFGDSTGNVLAEISGGTLPYQWNWDLPIVDTTLFIDSLFTGDYVLNVIDSNNCVYQETATVTQPDAPLTVTYDEVLPSCFEYSDGTLTLLPVGGTAPYSYLWNTGDTTISIDSLATGNFSAEILDTLGCFTSIDIFLAEPPELQISFDVDALAGCSPFVVQFTNTSNATANCEWDFGNGNTYTGCENVFNVYESGGIYSVSLTAYDDNGCFNDVTYDDFITVYQTPTAAMNVDPVYLYPDVPTTTISNESEGGDTFVWNMGESEQDFMGFEPGSYTYSPNLIDTFYVSLLAITDEGCVDSTQGMVVFLNDPFLYAPNTFTPDGNNVNDVWIPVYSSPGNVQRYNLDIYNRWGERVFETTDLNQGWDATYNGSPAQDGTYIWKINFRWYDQRTYELTGHIILIK